MTEKNILFIMADQLRFDYLSCYGHAHLQTPNIDWLASQGVAFDNAYVQSPICGPARMSYYTGRYVQSHGATWNQVPLKVGEMTMGDHLRKLGMRVALSGKTHMKADTQGMERLGIDPASNIGVLTSQCGFEPWDRLDGLHPISPGRPRPTYDDYLRSKGFEAENPWHDWANAAEGDDGELLSGWLMKYADKPARVPHEHSETAYCVSRAIDFIDEAGDQPWCLHLSMIKPHWPYIVSEPYHLMYGPQHVQAPQRSEAEQSDAAHPLFRAYQGSRVSKAFSRDDVRARVIPAYMGLIKQIDDEMGRLFDWLKSRGLFDNTMIVFTSDHGDYLGDHWLGEKELFHQPSVKVPLIIFDPSEAAKPARGTRSPALVEAIDLLPTFIQFAGGQVPDHILEGRALQPLLNGRVPAEWREIAISEYDYSTRHAAIVLGTAVKDARLIMAFDGRWKLVRTEGMRPMLFDLETDPLELKDLGDDPAYADQCERLTDAILRWSLRHSQRVTIADAGMIAMRGSETKAGIHIGMWDEADVAEAQGLGYSGN